MNSNHKHVLFFDHQCPFCRHLVKHVLQIDQEEIFVFASFTSRSAEEILTGPQKQLRQANGLVLVENYESTERDFLVQGRALLRIYWWMGKTWACLGVLSFFPETILNFFYRRMGEHRHRFKLDIPEDLEPKDRFLP